MLASREADADAVLVFADTNAVRRGVGLKKPNQSSNDCCYDSY